MKRGGMLSHPPSLPPRVSTRSTFLSRLLHRCACSAEFSPPPSRSHLRHRPLLLTSATASPRLRARGGMGSATSKLSSLSCIAPAVKVKALIILVLLLGAGAIAMLHPKDMFASGLEMRPPPRKRLRVKIEPTNYNKGCSNRRWRPRGSESLPRALVQYRSNLEMEASLGGNPERRKQQQETVLPLKKKSLLAVPVGIKNKKVVNKLVSRFPAVDFTVMLFHYDGAVEQWGDLEWSGRVVHVAAKGQTKWWFAKRFLHPDIVADYEYVFLWDEDIEVDAFDPLRYLDIIRREGLEISQPALDRRSEIHHAITARALMPTGDTHRRAQGTRCSSDSTGPPCEGWVEMMVPVFSRAAWRCTWYMVQNDLIHGWGLDYKLGYCAQGDRTRHIGVVDSEYVLHRGVPMLSDGNKATPSVDRAAVRWRSFKEMLMFNKRWEQAATEDKSWSDPYAAQPAMASSK